MLMVWTFALCLYVLWDLEGLELRCLGRDWNSGLFFFFNAKLSFNIKPSLFGLICGQNNALVRSTPTDGTSDRSQGIPAFITFDRPEGTYGWPLT